MSAIHRLRAFSAAKISPSSAHLVLADKLGVAHVELTTYVESGVLLWDGCRIRYPIIGGLPIMLGYTTPMHASFARDYGSELAKHSKGYEWPHGTSTGGERA